MPRLLRSVIIKRQGNEPGIHRWSAICPPWKRARCRDEDQLPSVLGPFVKKTNWISYAETMDHATINTSAIMDHKHMIKAVHVFWPSLTFTQKGMERALLAIYQQKHSADSSFFIEVLDDWAKRTALRFRTMCRHVGCGLRKSPTTGWVQSLELETTRVKHMLHPSASPRTSTSTAGI